MLRVIWSFRLVEPLPNGTVALAAGNLGDMFPDKQAAPIVVTVLPNHKYVAGHLPQSLARKPPTKQSSPVDAVP